MPALGDATIAKEYALNSADRSRSLLRAAIVVTALGALLWAWWSGAFDGLVSREAVEAAVQRAGPWGPAVIVALMTIAVVASPLPSAPIAVAAGAAYGHTTGTVYVAAGAELGAIIAFLLGRALGHDALRRRFGAKVDMGLLGSQNTLMTTVFLSRLMPFVSFDMISYAAGLTRLHLWRFAVATLAGIVPASFVLTHVGNALNDGMPLASMGLVLALGLVTGLPLIWAAWKTNAKGKRPGPVDTDRGGRRDRP